MSEIHYVTGDATNPVETGDSARVIVHVCNDVGAWGAGFVLALSAKDRRPEELYRRIASESVDGWLQLGTTQLSEFDDDDADVFVINMVAQRGFKTVLNNIPLDYKALRICLDEVGQHAVAMGSDTTVHMPRIGCGLAGGEWSKVEEAILESLIDIYHLDVYVYDLPKAA